MIQGKKILITGGAGFIGTHMTERLAPDNQITLFDIDLAGPIRHSTFRISSSNSVGCFDALRAIFLLRKTEILMN